MCYTTKWQSQPKVYSCTVRTTKVDLRTKMTLRSSKQKDSGACGSSIEQKTKKV